MKIQLTFLMFDKHKVWWANWLTTRSRPDLAFSVGAASRLIHRRPRYVISMCEHIMKYVNLTSSLALTYRQCATGDMGQQQELQVAKSMDTMQILRLGPTPSFEGTLKGYLKGTLKVPLKVLSPPTPPPPRRSEALRVPLRYPLSPPLSPPLRYPLSPP